MTDRGEHQDPFDQLTQGLNLGEWPDPGFEVVPPHKLEKLQDALVEHLVALGPLPEDEDECDIWLSELERLYGIDFEKLDVFRPGDIVKISNTGVIMCREAREDNYEVYELRENVISYAEVAGPYIIKAPLLETLDFEAAETDRSPQIPVGQIAASVSFRSSSIVVSHEGREISEHELGNNGELMCAPLIYTGMKVQKKVA